MNEIRKIVRNTLNESPQFKNTYKLKKIFKEGFMSFEDWIFVNDEKFILQNDSEPLHLILKHKMNTKVTYISEYGDKEINFIFRIYKSRLIPNDVIVKENERS